MDDQQTKKKLFCRQPFEMMMIGNAGQNWLCCPTWLPHPVGATDSLNFLEDWNSKRAQEIRSSILDGSFSMCSKACPHLVEGSESITPADEVEDETFLHAIRNNDPKIANGPSVVYLCHDRSCNLACPSCRRGHFVAKDEYYDRVVKIQNEALEQVKPSLKTLIVAGDGDPFGSPAMFRLLQDLQPAEFPRLQSVNLHTNGQLLNQTTWQKLHKIHPYVSKIHISIDAATEETYKTNRKGGRFSRILKNLEFVSSLDSEVTISFVVQTNNFREMKGFVRLGRAHFDFKVNFTHLDNWGVLDSENYAERAVHLPQHPAHSELRAELTSSVFNDKKVSLGNLHHLRAQ